MEAHLKPQLPHNQHNNIFLHTSTMPDDSTQRTPAPHAVDVAFDSVTYEIPAKKRFQLFGDKSANLNQDGPITILHSISGYVAAGESLAILGPSGSGKTSFLNLLAARSQHPPKTGRILFSGRPRVPRTKRHIGYVMQDDVFFSKLTVRETLEFTANIRLPDSVSREEKKRRVDQVMHRLRLTKCQHTRIGDQQFDKGISGGERKRVNIANELLHDPSLLLADECTSGLDSSSAYTVINLLRELCQEGRTVIATIHQPSSQMFSVFDKIMLLAAGHLAYFGPPGKVIRYFAAIDFPFPETSYNPADYMLELVIDDRLPDDDPDLPSTQERILAAWEAGGPERVGEGGQAVTRPNSVVVEQTSLDHTAIRIDGSDVTIAERRDEDDADKAAQTSDDRSTSDSPESDEATPKPVLKSLKCDPEGPNSFFGRMPRAVKKRMWDVSGQHGKHDEPDKYPTNWFTQCRVLGHRALRQKRGVLIQPIYVSQVILVTVISCLAWFQMDAREGTIEDRLGALSFVSVFWAFYSSFSALFAFPSEKQVLNKDRAGGSYRLSAYYFAKSMVETPADMLYPATFTVVSYFTIGLNPRFAAFILFGVVLILDVLAAQSIGLLISALVMNIRQAQVIASCWILSSMLISGYYVDPDNTPRFVKPLRFVSFIKYSYEAMVRIEMIGGRSFRCAIGNEAQTIYSNDCPIGLNSLLKGAQLTDTLSIQGNILVLIAWIVIARAFGYFALKYLHTSHKPRASSWKQ